MGRSSTPMSKRPTPSDWFSTDSKSQRITTNCNVNLVKAQAKVKVLVTACGLKSLIRKGNHGDDACGANLSPQGAL